jgi:hypothetical protein
MFWRCVVFMVLIKQVWKKLDDKKSMHKLLQRKQDIPVTRGPGPACQNIGAAIPITASRCPAADSPFSKLAPVSPFRPGVVVDE